MNTIKKIAKEIGITTLSFALALFLFMGAALVMAAWANPAQNPPQGNVPQPVNVSSDWQVKTGTLGVRDLWLTEWPYRDTQYTTGTWVGGSLIDLQTSWQLLAKGSDWTEEALITLGSSTRKVVTDAQYANQRVNLGAVHWPKDPDLVSEIVLVVKNDHDDYCAGGDGIQSLVNAASVFPSVCWDLRRKGTTETWVQTGGSGRDDWIRLRINGRGMTNCPDALTIGTSWSTAPRYGTSYSGTSCYYQKANGSNSWNGDLNLLQIEEVDNSGSFGAWEWEIWYRYFDKTTPPPAPGVPPPPGSGGGSGRDNSRRPVSF